MDETKEIIKQAIRHKGYSLVDIFQPCVSFNKINTHKWFRENTYFLEEGYDPTDRKAAMMKAFEKEPYPLGILYREEGKKTFEENLACYAEDKTPLYRRKRKPALVAQFLKELE